MIIFLSNLGGKILKVVVNLITALRLIFTIILPILKERVSMWAFIIDIGLLFLTDFLDGFLARKYKVQTLFGSLLDTVADKTLSIMLLIMLIGNNKILIIVLILECIIAITNMITVGLKKKTKSSMLGKIKTWIISFTIILGYMYEFSFIDIIFVRIFAIITIIMQVFVAIGYVKKLIVAKTSDDKEEKVFKTKGLKYVLLILIIIWKNFITPRNRSYFS